MSLRSEADLIGEVLLVDDSSSDGTAAAAEQAAAQLSLPLRVLRAEFRNAGGARNLALAETVSPWIYLLDADDLHLELGLRSMLAEASSNAGADMVIGLLCQAGERRRSQIQVAWPLHSRRPRQRRQLP